MDIQDYRRQLEQEIADERTAADEPRWEESLETVGAHEEIGPATGGEDDSERLSTVLANREADPDLRVAALSGLTSRNDDEDTMHETALQLLADETEATPLRAAALQTLKVLTIHSPTAADWRPAYLDALRSASRADDQGLRHAAFEVLAVMKDRESQAVLLRGLEDPDQARIAPEHALRLLAHDPHSGVRDVARAHVDAPPSKAAHFEALRALASDSDSIERFRTLLTDSTESTAVRKLAATALSSMDRDALRASHDELDAGAGLESVGTAARSASEEHVRKHIAALLELPE